VLHKIFEEGRGGDGKGRDLMDVKNEFTSSIPNLEGTFFNSIHLRGRDNIFPPSSL
jgi:hypothetical protein